MSALSSAARVIFSQGMMFGGFGFCVRSASGKNIALDIRAEVGQRSVSELVGDGTGKIQSHCIKWLRILWVLLQILCGLLSFFLSGPWMSLSFLVALWGWLLVALIERKAVSCP